MFLSLQDDKRFYKYNETQFFQFKNCLRKVSYNSTSLDLAADIEKINYILRI